MVFTLKFPLHNWFIHPLKCCLNDRVQKHNYCLAVSVTHFNYFLFSYDFILAKLHGCVKI